MEDGQARSVKNLPPGRLNNIRQQFEQNASAQQAFPIKTPRPHKIPIPRGDGGHSASSGIEKPAPYSGEGDAVPPVPRKPTSHSAEGDSVPLIPPKTAPNSGDGDAVPPIPPKENCMASKIQRFSPSAANIPQPTRATATPSRRSPVGNCVSPRQVTPKPLLDSTTQTQADVNKMYAIVNKQKNSDQNADTQHSHRVTWNTDKKMENIHQHEINNTTPKKEKPPILDKPKLTKKPTSEWESSGQQVHVTTHRQHSPKPHAQVPSSNAKVLQTSKSLSGDWLCLVEDKYRGVSSVEVAPPRPPTKPPRTHAHDKYLETGTGRPRNGKIPISPRRSTTSRDQHRRHHSSEHKSSVDTTDQHRRHHSSEHKSTMDPTTGPSPKLAVAESSEVGGDQQRRPEKPKRPPPPRPKSSPSFSSARNFTYTEDPRGERKARRMKSPVFDKHGKVQPAEMMRNPVFLPGSDCVSLPVVKPSPIAVTSPPGVHHSALHNEIRMGLASSNFRPPSPGARGLWRSCSDECVYMEPSLSGDPVYMDPMETCRVTSLDDTYASHDVEVYIDADGYAVPHRHKKLGGPQSPGVGMKDKFRGVFRMFSDPAQTPDTPRGQKRRLAAVRQKINQAFSLLQKIVRKRESLGEPAKDVNRLSLDSDSFVDVNEIMKRVEYVNSVKVRTHASVRNVRRFMEKIYPQLFECAVIVELQQQQVDGKLQNIPVVKHKFPEMVNIAETIPQFCFPDANNLNMKLLKPSKSETYSFVLTNSDGNHVFGYCRRYTATDDDLNRLEVICILSPLGDFQMYTQLLYEMEGHRKISFDFAQELIASSFGRPLPSPGKMVQIRTMTDDGEVETITLSRAMENQLENVNYECLLSVLGVDKMVKVFASMLLERRLLFFASSLSVLSSTIQALVSLLYPFLWHHAYIPVLPPALIDVVCSPTPFIIGTLSSEMARLDKLPMEEALIIDLDSKCFYKVIGDETTILPQKLQKALKTALNLCRMESDKQSQNLMMSEAFMRLFVEMVGNFGEFVLTLPDGKKAFQKDEFISGARSDSISQLLQWFTETQMFEVFITDQLERDHHKTAELFLTRIMEYKESGHALPSLKSNVRQLGKRMKNLGKAIKTKLT